MYYEYQKECNSGLSFPNRHHCTIKLRNYYLVGLPIHRFANMLVNLAVLRETRHFGLFGVPLRRTVGFLVQGRCDKILKDVCCGVQLTNG